MPFHIVRDDLANMRVDAVVVPANPLLIIDGGAGKSIALIAGLERMQAALDEIGECPVGNAVVTSAFDFPAKMVVHAVGPVWMGGQLGEASALASCVNAALEASVRGGAKSIAIPLLSTGAFGYPTGEAIDIETRAIRDFLEDNDIDVSLVLYDRESVRVGRSLFTDIQEYIDDVYVGEHPYDRVLAPDDGAIQPQDSGSQRFLDASVLPQSSGDRCSGIVPDWSGGSGNQDFEGASDWRGAPAETTVASLAMAVAAPLAASAAPQESLADRLSNLDESFAQTVLRLIDEHGLTDVEVYKRANMSRQLFAKIRKDGGYRPTKKTACALAFALELDHGETLSLLSRAGFTLSHSSKFDVIIEYFLVNGVYDIFQVNEALFAYDQPLLG